MQKKETRGQPAASCLEWRVASAIVVLRYKGNKWQSKAVVKMIQN